MATVHPSRLDMVPQVRAAPPRRSPSPPPPALTREEELKQRLLAKRNKRDVSSGSRTPEAVAVHTGGGMKIKGSSKGQEGTEEAPLADIYQDQPRLSRQEPRERYPEAGPSRRVDGDSYVPDSRRSTSPGRAAWSDARTDRSRPRSRSRSRSRPRRDEQSPRRASPSREDRRRPPLPHPRAGAEDTRGTTSKMADYGYSTQRGDLRQAPPHLPPFPPKWDSRQPPPGQGNVSGYAPAPLRMGFDAPPPQNRGFGGGGGGYRNNGPIDFEKRRQEREDNPLSIWPPSPKSPYRDEDAMALSKTKKKSKKSKSKLKKHRRYSDESDSTDSEEDRRRRRRREKRRRQADKYSDEEGSIRKASRRRRETTEPETDSEDERDRRRRTRVSRSKSRSALSPASGKEKEKDWIEKDAEGVVGQIAAAIPEIESDDDDDLVGPQLPSEHKDRARRQAFKDMLPGEAEAMAAYAASGQRIPRRGEIGIDASRIEEFEASGFVMSGNRHKKMTAVRLKKENQVISAEEKRAILNLQKEERMKKEGAIISQFKELLDDNWRSQGLKDKP